MAAKREMLNGLINRIALVGVEMEGGWSGALPAGENIVRDGSIQFDPPKRIRDAVTGLQTYSHVPPDYVGEAVSKTMKVTEVEAWVRKCQPHHVHKTCGLHVHMSFFNKLNYSRLMTPDYMEWMIEQLRLWGTNQQLPADHRFWARLDPNDPHTLRYCAHRFLGDAQAMNPKRHDYNSYGTERSRYTFINYPDRQTGTVECRGLPAFETADLSVGAVMAVLDATNRFLSKIRQRERAVEASILEKPPVMQEFGVMVR